MSREQNTSLSPSPFTRKLLSEPHLVGAFMLQWAYKYFFEIMRNSFESRGSVPPRQEHASDETRESTMETMAQIPDQLRRFAADFEKAIQPTIEMTKKGDRATWMDRVGALYAAGEFALPRIRRGMEALDTYLKSRK